MVRQAIRNTVGNLTLITGVTALARQRWPRRGALILMFHRVRDDTDAFLGGIRTGPFEQLIRYLRKYYLPISLSELLTHIRERQPVPPNSVVLTFDDGFRDNYDHAFPVLRRYGVPATIFLVTDSVETGELPWPQRVGYILQHTTRVETSIDAHGSQSFRLQTSRERLTAFEQVLKLRRSLPLGELESIVDQLSESCDVIPPRDRMLTWDQIKEMGRHGIAFGAHTRTHPLMAYLPLEVAKDQLLGSKEMIEKRLGGKVRHFCFPTGSLNDQLVELAKQVGFESVFRPTRRQQVNTHLSDPHALRRWGAYDPFPAMAAELAGILETLRCRRPTG